MNGHTPGVSVLGSDEKRAKKRESRHGSERDFNARIDGRVGRCLNGERSWNAGGTCSDVLLVGHRFRQRLSGWSSALVRCGAACLIRAATRHTWFLARSVFDDTRSGRQSDGRGKQRDYDCDRNRHSPNHQRTDSTIVALNRDRHLSPVRAEVVPSLWLHCFDRRRNQIVFDPLTRQPFSNEGPRGIF